MVMKALIIHGICSKKEYFSDKYPSLSNSHWFPWLQKQLLKRSIFTQTPEMPDAFCPNYGKWKEEFERFCVGEDTILIGHSCGGGFLVRWLSENKVKPLKLILVAPWLDPGKKTTDFFEFAIDRNLSDRTCIYVFISEDDSKDILKSTEIIQNDIPKINVCKFKNKGHFTYNDMKTHTFPEILKVILPKIIQNYESYFSSSRGLFFPKGWD